MTNLFKFSLLLLATLLPAIASAHSFVVDGIYYKIIGTEASVTYKGTSYYPYGNTYYYDDVVIPSTVTYNGTTYSVTSIGNYAFGTCYSLTSVTIPSSVTTIGEHAFYGCSGMTSVTIPSSVTSIGNSAFENCSSLTSATIPNSVTSISKSAFQNCSGLTSITIPNSVTSIGDRAFQNCSGLTSVTIGNSVTSIGNWAFYDCSGLASVTIPNSVTGIGKDAFNGCTGLTSVTIGNSVTSIDNGAFYYCFRLTRVICMATTPPNIVSWAFNDDVTSQATLYVPDESISAYQTSFNWKEFLQIVGITETPAFGDFEVDGIWYRSLSENTAMVIQRPEDEDYYSGDVVIPESVTYESNCFTVVGISEGAFEDCYELNSVVIGNAVESIGENTFQGCTALTSVIIGSGVSSIRAKAFNYCNALQTVTCRGTVPPVMESSNCFTNAAYLHAVLKVPRQQVDAYAVADYWYKFEQLEGYGSAGKGDVNTDGIINISDVTALIDLILSGGEYNPDADFNYNGKYDIGDVTTLIDFLLTGTSN